MSWIGDLATPFTPAGLPRSGDRRRVAERLAVLRPTPELRTRRAARLGSRIRSGAPGGLFRLLDRLLGIDRAHVSDEPISLLLPLLTTAGVAAAVHSALTFLLVLPQALAVIIAVPIGVMGGRGFVGRHRDATHRRMEDQFALALGVIIRGVRAGLPVAEGMRAVAAELPAPTGPEFQSAVDQIQFGDSFEGALAGLATRCVLPEYRFFAVTVGLQRQTGGNLAETLDNLHQTMRARRGIQLKAKALTSETRATVLVLALLPAFVGGVLLIVSPTYVLELFVTASGRFLLGIALVVQAIGLLIIRSISRRTMA